MDKLIRYFQNEDATQKALSCYLQFSKSRQWYIGSQSGKIRLYNEASQAFSSENLPTEALAAFHIVYDDHVRLWPGVQRGGNLALAEEVFAVLNSYHGNKVLDGTVIHLANLTYPSAEANQIKAFLPSLKFCKANNSIPVDAGF